MNLFLSFEFVLQSHSKTMLLLSKSKILEKSFINLNKLILSVR